MLSVCYMDYYLIKTQGNGYNIADGENEAGSNYSDDKEPENGDYAEKKGRKHVFLDITFSPKLQKERINITFLINNGGLYGFRMF